MPRSTPVAAVASTVPPAASTAPVRAAGAVAEHFLRRGDRVGLCTFGGAGTVRVPARAGMGHLRRLLVETSLVEVGRPGLRSTEPLLPLLRDRVDAGGLVVMLSPLLSPRALTESVALVRRGLTVVVVDTFPDEVPDDPADPTLQLAWRIRLLERRRDIDLVQREGVPVVAWHGPGSIDQVLRDLARRTGTPRMASR